jgi:hypothetical protein
MSLKHFKTFFIKRGKKWLLLCSVVCTHETNFVLTPIPLYLIIIHLLFIKRWIWRTKTTQKPFVDITCNITEANLSMIRLLWKFLLPLTIWVTDSYFIPKKFFSRNLKLIHIRSLHNVNKIFLSEFPATCQVSYDSFTYGFSKDKKWYQFYFNNHCHLSFNFRYIFSGQKKLEVDLIMALVACLTSRTRVW